MSLAFVIAIGASDSTRTPNLSLDRTAARKGERIPGLLVLSAPVDSANFTVRMVPTASGSVWFRSQGETCKAAENRQTKEIGNGSSARWSGRIVGDTVLYPCLRLNNEGSARLLAIVRRPDLAERTGPIVVSSSPVAARPGLTSSPLFLPLLTSVLGFLSGVFLNWLNTRQEQSGQRKMRQVELDDAARARKEAEDREGAEKRAAEAAAERMARINLETLIYERITAALHDNADGLRAFLAHPDRYDGYVQEDKIGSVVQDKTLREQLMQGPRAGWVPLLDDLFATMHEHNNLVDQGGNDGAVRASAEALRTTIEEALRNLPALSGAPGG